MGLCNTKEEAEDFSDRASSLRKMSTKVNPNNSISVLEMEFKQSKDYYDNILHTQEEEPEEPYTNQDPGQLAYSYDKNRSFPEKSLLSHSTVEELVLDEPIEPSTPNKFHILRTSSDISFKPQYRRKSHGDAEFTIDMRIDTVKGGNSLEVEKGPKDLLLQE